MNESGYPPAPFTGWLRELPRGRWKPVCGGSTYSGCWTLLLAVPAWTNAERLVLPGGEHPTREKHANH